jgi:hypothetical protein
MLMDEFMSLVLLRRRLGCWRAFADVLCGDLRRLAGLREEDDR